MRAQVFVITSGKGGVGKTLVTAAIGTELAQQGFRVVVLDFDIGLRNLDLIMGCERRVLYDIINVINGEATLQQALIQDKILDNLFILPAAEARNKTDLTKDGIAKIMESLKTDFDFILCDSPSGIEQGALLAMYYAEHAIIVITPELAAIRAAQRMLGLLISQTKHARAGKEITKYLLINRMPAEASKKSPYLSIADIKESLGIKLLGVLPEVMFGKKNSADSASSKLYDAEELQQACHGCVNVLLGIEPYIEPAEIRGWNILKKIIKKQTLSLED